MIFVRRLFHNGKKTLLDTGEKTRKKQRCLSPSEIITLIVHYHQSGYETFKWFYQRHLLKNLTKAFPKLPS